MTAFLMHMKPAACRGGTFPYDSAVSWSVLHLFSSLWVIALCSSFGEPCISSPLVNQMALPSPDKGVGTGCNQGQSDTLSWAGYFLWLVAPWGNHPQIPAICISGAAPCSSLPFQLCHVGPGSVSTAWNQRTSNDTPVLGRVEFHFPWWISQCLQTKPLLNWVKGRRGTVLGFWKIRHDFNNLNILTQTYWF